MTVKQQMASMREDHQHQYEKRAKRRLIRKFHDAISSNNLEEVEKQLTSELDVNFHYGGQSALQIAVTKGFKQICELLINHGADVNKYNADDNSLLNMAAWRGFSEIAALLVANEVDLEISNNHGDTALNTAGAKGYTKIVKVLVDAGAFIDKCNNCGQSPLVTCAVHGHVDAANALIEAGCNINWTDHERKTALITAAESGHLEFIKVLLKAGCNIDAHEKYGTTAVSVATKNGYSDIVKCLVDGKANLDIADAKGNTALLYAVKGRQVDIATLLAKAGCDLNLSDHDNKQTAIHAAVRIASQYFGSEDAQMKIAKMLISCQCDLDAQDSSGWTPLFQAAFGGDLGLVKLLLEHGASVKPLTESGDCVLHGAVFGNKPQIMQMLLDAGCSVNSVNSRNELPLYSAINHRCCIEIIQLFLAVGSETEICESTAHQSPLFCAIQQNFFEAVQLLIDAGCNINTPNDCGNTPLWAACHNGCKEIVDLLLAHPDVQIDAGYERVPIHAASLNGYHDIACSLIKAGCNVNKMSDICTTALYFATKCNHSNLVHLLIEHGANPNQAALAPAPQPCCRHFTDPHPHLEIDPLYNAVMNDNFIAIKLLLLGAPTMPYHNLGILRDILFRTNYLQEARIDQKSILQHASFFRNILSRPRLLQQECRGVIRQALNVNLVEKVLLLPIPTKLKDYLLLKDALAAFKF